MIISPEQDQFFCLVQEPENRQKNLASEAGRLCPFLCWCQYLRIHVQSVFLSHAVDYFGFRFSRTPKFCVKVQLITRIPVNLDLGQPETGKFHFYLQNDRLLVFPATPQKVRICIQVLLLLIYGEIRLKNVIKNHKQTKQLHNCYRTIRHFQSVYYEGL